MKSTTHVAVANCIATACPRQREFVVDNLLVRIHFIIVMIRWTGLAPWEFEFHFSGSLTSTFLVPETFHTETVLILKL